jgi:hypothetical protein
MTHLIYSLITKLPLLYPKFTIFLILLSICLLLLYLNKKSENKSSNIIPEENIFIVLKPYYLEDLWLTIVLISFYFMITVGIFLSLRMYNIGYIRSLQEYNLSITPMDISIFILFISCMGLYKTLLSLRLPTEIFKLYLYIRSTNPGQTLIENIWHLYHAGTKLNNVLHFLKDIDITLSLEDRMNAYKISYEEDRLIPLKYRIRTFSSKYIYLGKVIHIIRSNFFTIVVYWPIMYKYSIHFILFVVLLYDLKQKALYYIYIALPIYMILILYKKVRTYIGETDLLYDEILVNYFYKSQAYKQMTEIGYRQMVPIEEAYAIREHNMAIRAYISKGYKADYIPENPNETIYDKIVKKGYILVSLSILCWYLLFNTTLYNTCILTIPLAIIYSTSNVTMLTSNMWQTLNKIMVVSTLGITSWVYLTRTSFIYIRDTIWDYSIVITQTFTLEEKLEYLKHALSQVPLNKEYLLQVLDITFIKSLINEETTISQLKEYVENLVIITIKLEATYLKSFHTVVDPQESSESFPFDISDSLQHYLQNILEAYPNITMSLFVLLTILLSKFYPTDEYLLKYPNIYERLFKLIKDFFTS